MLFFFLREINLFTAYDEYTRHDQHHTVAFMTNIFAFIKLRFISLIEYGPFDVTWFNATVTRFYNESSGIFYIYFVYSICLICFNIFKHLDLPDHPKFLSSYNSIVRKKAVQQNNILHIMLIHSVSFTWSSPSC